MSRGIGLHSIGLGVAGIVLTGAAPALLEIVIGVPMVLSTRAWFKGRVTSFAADLPPGLAIGGTNGMIAGTIPDFFEGVLTVTASASGRAVAETVPIRAYALQDYPSSLPPAAVRAAYF